MTMSLKEWQERNKWLVAHTATRSEIRALLSGAQQDLRESAAEGLGPDWRLAIAYNGFLRAATAALAASGYRVARSTDHHYTVIQSLALTLEWQARDIRTVDGFRKKRNMAGYERAGIVSVEEAEEMVSLTTRLHRDVSAWIKTNHPDLA